MMQGYSLSATLTEDPGLGERFWYWRGASGQPYIHSIYAPDLCPPVAGAVFVVVRDLARFRERFPHATVVLADGSLFSWYGSRMAQFPDYVLKFREQCGF